MSVSKQNNNPILKLIDVLLKWIERLFNTAAIIALSAIMLIVLYQIIGRLLPQAPVWTEELSRYLFVYTIVLASAAVIIRKRHVRLELFHHKFSPRVNLIFDLLGHLIIAVFAIILIKYAWDYTYVGRRQTSASMKFLNMALVYASTLIFFSLVSLVSLLMVARNAVEIREAWK